MKSEQQSSGQIGPVRDLSYELLGIPVENPFILAAGPSTDDIDMVRRAFAMGWGGAVLKTTSVEGTRVDLAYPMMSAFNHDEKLLFGLGNIDLISTKVCASVSPSPLPPSRPETSG